MTVEAAGRFMAFPGVSEHVYGPRDFDRIRELIYRESANVLPPSKSTLVYSRLAPLVRNSGSGTFSNYIAKISDDAEERRRAVQALTTNHTGFFREEHHFEHFAEHVRPLILAKIKARQPVRLWSSACSSGEEVYSLCMTLLGSDRNVARDILAGDVAVLATDIADHVLEKARAGRYPAETLAPVPNDLRTAWLQMDADGGVVAETVRNLVRFRRLNLVKRWPITTKFDVIFCRNVMIYFDQETKDQLVDRFVDHLDPGGYLYVGHSERVMGPAAARVELVDKTTYRRL